MLHSFRDADRRGFVSRTIREAHRPWPFAPDGRILLTFSHPAGQRGGGGDVDAQAIADSREGRKEVPRARRRSQSYPALRHRRRISNSRIAAASNRALHADRFVMSFGISVLKRTIPVAASSSNPPSSHHRHREKTIDDSRSPVSLGRRAEFFSSVPSNVAEGMNPKITL